MKYNTNKFHGQDHAISEDKITEGVEEYFAEKQAGEALANSEVDSFEYEAIDEKVTRVSIDVLGSQEPVDIPVLYRLGSLATRR